jgi:hypothetical protein
LKSVLNWRKVILVVCDGEDEKSIKVKSVNNDVRCTLNDFSLCLNNNVGRCLKAVNLTVYAFTLS